ncbi:CinA family protein [Leucobacter zeae]|nr:CinA family protein [Leucobacter zeae]
MSAAPGGAARLDELVAGLIEAAAAQGLRIAVAESLTGGRLADALVSVPGASRVFSGGIVAYDTALKESLLGVDPDLLRERGPVDEQVARQMAAGVRAVCAVPRAPGGAPVPADIGLSTTGVAGPDPDPQTGLPAGVVWVGVSSGRGTTAIRLDLGERRPADAHGSARPDRAAIRAAAVAAAIGLLGDAVAPSSRP